MTPKVIMIIIGALFFVAVDWYVFQAIKVISKDYLPWLRNTIFTAYWLILGLSLTAFLYYHLAGITEFNKYFRTYLMTGIFINYFSKVFAVIFLLISDLIRGGQWLVGKVGNLVASAPSETASAISRSEFLVQTGLVVAAVPLTAMSYGIVKGAHNYSVRREELFLPNLPAAFDGVKIAQISDIHAGSFVNKTAVMGGVEKIMAEKPDMVFFTGDLVNYAAKEMQDYINVFDKVKAPLGVYSVMGNHDYGEYKTWVNEEARKRNKENFQLVHRNLGWDLLLNENRKIRVDGEEIAVVGVENWGRTDWSQKYGQLDKALENTKDTPVKLLLSHDPSHWEAQVLDHPATIDLMLSGHTHGFQFGLEIGDFKWSPAQYVYKQWAGMYNRDNQHLYVNRGFGYLGFPGRIGMPPEITVITLKKA